MQDTAINIKQIRSLTIRGIIGYLPIFIASLVDPLLKNLPDVIETLILLPMFISFIYGCIVFGKAANKYAAYKGYSNPLYLYSILNILVYVFYFY